MSWYQSNGTDVYICLPADVILSVTKSENLQLSDKIAHFSVEIKISLHFCGASKVDEGLFLN